MENMSTQFWKQWLGLQVEHNLSEIAKISIKDFHFKGLNYISFQFQPNLTIRLYVIRNDEPVDTENVSIHNHLYDSQLLVLSGWLKNRVHRKIEGDEYNHYHLTSALAPDNEEKRIKLKHLGRVGLEVVDETVMTPGMFHLQRHNEIHNVTNNPDQLAAWMVFEFPTVKNNSILFTKKDLGATIPTNGCYNRFTEQEIRYIVNDVISSM